LFVLRCAVVRIRRVVRELRNLAPIQAESALPDARRVQADAPSGSARVSLTIFSMVALGFDDNAAVAGRQPSGHCTRMIALVRSNVQQRYVR
jgi:hypothetical protein